jgi:hypothetical protein
MITLNIDNQTYSNWRAQASTLGLSVEDWLMSRTVEREMKFGESANDDTSPPHSGIRARLEAIARRHQPTGLPVEVSRESIYD